MRKALGWLMLFIGLSGIILSIMGAVTGRRVIDAIGESLQSNLTLTVESLETVRETLILTKSTVAQLDTGLETAVEAASNVSVALAETGPMLVEGSRVVTQDVPLSIETLQDSMPALIEVSGAIDSTLRTLSAFGVERSILGIPLSFDLGVDYDPEVPFDESVLELSESLDGMPQQLRGLEEVIGTTNDNLLIISQDLARLSVDLENMNGNMDEIEPLLDDYLVIVTDIGDNTRQSRLLLGQQLAQAKLVLTIIMVWFGLLQLAPIYLGWEIISGRRERDLTAGIERVSDEPVKSRTEVVVHEETVETDGDDE